MTDVDLIPFVKMRLKRRKTLFFTVMCQLSLDETRAL